MSLACFCRDVSVVDIMPKVIISHIETRLTVLNTIRTNKRTNELTQIDFSEQLNIESHAMTAVNN